MQQKKNQNVTKRSGPGRAHQVPARGSSQPHTPHTPSTTSQYEPDVAVANGERYPWKLVTMLDNIISDETAEAFNKRFWYPACMTSSIRSLTNFMFLQGMLFIAASPLTRYMEGVWKEVVPPLWLWNQLNRVLFGGDDAVKYGFTYQGTEQPAVNSGWMLHAAFGIIWLICGWLQISVVPKKYHARFAFISLPALCLHIGYSAYVLLFVDQQRHTTVNKVVLASLILLSFAYMLVGTVVGVAGYLRRDPTKWPGRNWRKTHIDMMFRGWMWSISGAGPTRMVVSIMHPLGYGPIRCQEAHGSFASDCLWSYLGRLLMVATWNQFVTGAYCKIRQDTYLTKTYLANVVLHVVMCGSFWLMSLYGDESAEFLSLVAGAPATNFSWVMTWVIMFTDVLQLAVTFPRQFIGGSLAAPAALVGFLVSKYCF